MKTEMVNVRQLWAAVLNRAVEDMSGYTHARSAIKFLQTSDSDFAFFACGIDAKAAREALFGHS